jgi:hypothetical protein
MQPQTPIITAALIADSTVSGYTTTNIFPDSPPTEAALSLGCLTYEENLTPADSADNSETAYEIEFNIEVYLLKDAWPLATAVILVMKSLGYVTVFAKNAGVVGTAHQVSMQFRNIKED